MGPQGGFTLGHPVSAHRCCAVQTGAALLGFPQLPRPKVSSGKFWGPWFVSVTGEEGVGLTPEPFPEPHLMWGWQPLGCLAQAILGAGCQV